MMISLLPDAPGRSRTHCVLIALLVTALALTAVPSPVDAAPRELHVDPTGSDEARGTASDPWRSVYHAMEQARAGDTILLHGGVYEERIGTLRPLPKGTPDARITLRNAAGERPVIRGMLNVFKGGFHYWTIQGIEVVPDAKLQPNEALVRLVDGVGWELRDMTIHGNRSYAAVRIMAEQPGLASNWAIRDSCIHSTRPVNGTNNDHNIYIGADSRHGVAPGPGVLEGNVIYGALNGANLKLGPGEAHLPGTSRVTVRDNVMGGAPQNIIIPWKSHDNVVEDNLLFQQHNGTWSQPWYPNVRGVDLTGSGNRARYNVGSNDARVVDTWGSPADIAETGNVDVDFRIDDAQDPCTELRELGGVGRVVGPDSIVERRAGATRTGTAAALSRATFGAARAVVLARADQYADALAGAPLARHIGGPLLLTDSGSLSSEAREEIQRLRPSDVYLMGGPLAISREVAEQVEALGPRIRRVAGANRFDTAARVLELLPEATTAYVVEGANADPRRGWPDAVALAPLAAAQTAPILLTTRDDLPTETQRAVRDLPEDAEVVVVGGGAAVSEGVERHLASAARDGSRAVRRIAGITRYETSASLALRSTSSVGADPSTLWLVSGENWPDALAAGPAAAASGATMLFVNPTDARNSPPVLAWLEDRVDDDRLSITVVGGPGAVSDGAIVSLAYGLD